MNSNNLYSISERSKFLLDSFSDESSPYYFISKLNNYKFITNPDVEDILIDLCKFLGFNITKDSSVTAYKSNIKSYITHYTLKHAIIRKKILYHFKSPFLNKSNLRNQGLRFLHREKRVEEYYNILKNDNIALREYPNTEIIGMDIDTHNYFSKNKTTIPQRRFLFEKLCNEIYSTIKKVIPLHILYIETSRIHRGLHFYFKLKNCHNKLFIEEKIKKYLEKEFPNIKVEFRSKTHALRLPLSADYIARDVNTFKKIIKLNKSITSPFKNINNELIDNTSISDHLRAITEPIPESIFPEDKKCPYYRPSKLTTVNDISYTSPIEKFKIYDGNRVGGNRTWWRLVNWCIHNKKTVEEFTQLTLECNVNSKDISSWSSQELTTQCNKLYAIARKNFRPYDNYISIHKTNIFHSNLALVTSKEKKAVKSYIYKLKKILPDTKFKNRLLKDSELCFLEFFGKIEYELLCPRKIFKNAKITNTKREDLLKGYQFPITYLKKLKENYGIKSNIKVIFRIFRMFFLEPIIHSNGKTLYIPSLGSCTQYTVTTFIQSLLGIPSRSLSILTTDKLRSFLPSLREEKHIIMLSELGFSSIIFRSLKHNFRYFNRKLKIIDDWLRKHENKLVSYLDRLAMIRV